MPNFTVYMKLIGLGILTVLWAHLDVVGEDWESSFQGLGTADDPYRDLSVEHEEPEKSFESPWISAEGSGSVFYRIYHRRKEHALGSLWGLYNPLEFAGITIESTITMDWSNNFTGGINTNGSAFRHLYQMAITIDTQQLFNWKDSTVFLLFQNRNGTNALIEDVGDFQYRWRRKNPVVRVVVPASGSVRPAAAEAWQVRR